MNQRIALLPFVLGLAPVALACGDASVGGEDEAVESTASELAVALPGRVQAESYNAGGEGVGYHDTTPENLGGALRSDAVDIEASPGGGHDVGWTAIGEWLAYDIRVTTAGTYTIATRVAAATPEARAFHFELDGRALAGGSARLAGGDGWHSWKEVSTPPVTLPAGAHVLKLVFDSAKINVDWFEVRAEGSTPTIAFGMYNNTAIPPATEVSSTASFRSIVDEHYLPARSKIRRSFNADIPTSYATSAAGKDPASGVVSFLSVKPPGGGAAGAKAVAEGRHDARIRALAASMPAGSYFTMFHEPEDNLEGPEFVAMFRRFYAVAKAANSKVTIGYVAMAYQWRPNSPRTPRPDAWWPGADATDFLGVDVYDAGYEGPTSLDVQPDFQRWYAWAKGKSKPLVIAEYGVEAETGGGFADDARAGVITRSMDWAARNGIRMVLYWNGTDATPGGRNWYLNPTTSDRDDRFTRSRKAWNDGVAKHGRTSTSL